VSMIPRGGTRLFQVSAGQSLAVGCFGGGSCIIKTAPVTFSQLPDSYSVHSVVINDPTVITFADATKIMIEAPYSSDVEFDYGDAPVLSIYGKSVEAGIIAHASGGQANATQIVSAINRIGTVGTTGDSVKLPSATVGKMVSVFNDGANAADVFPQTDEIIGSLSADTSVSVAVGKGIMFSCSVDGSWDSVVGA